MLIAELGNITVDNIDQLSEVLSECLTSFCEELEKQPGMTRPVGSDDTDAEGCLSLWTDAGIRLVDAEIERLREIGCSYFFHEDEIVIESTLYCEL